MGETHFNIKKKTAVWSSDFNASIDEKGIWTGSVSFHCYLDDAPDLVPKKGDKCQEEGYGFMSFDKAKIENIEGMVAKVTCYYGGTQNAEYDPDEEQDLVVSKELAISTSEEPLETHPRYKDLSKEQQLHVQAFKDGRMKEVEGTYQEADGVPTSWQFVYKDETNKSKKVELTGLELELVTKINNGFTHYLAARQVWRVSMAQSEMVSAARLNRVGFVTTALEAPEVQNRDWLFVGCNVNEENGVFNVTYEWRLSDYSNWDDIYDYDKKGD